MQPTIHFPINISLICNQIPDHTGEMNFLQSKGGQFILSLQEQTDFDCVILNLCLIYRNFKMKRGLHDSPRFRLSDTGMEQFPSQHISFITTQFGIAEIAALTVASQ